MHPICACTRSARFTDLQSTQTSFRILQNSSERDLLLILPALVTFRRFSYIFCDCFQLLNGFLQRSSTRWCLVGLTWKAGKPWASVMSRDRRRRMCHICFWWSEDSYPGCRNGRTCTQVRMTTGRSFPLLHLPAPKASPKPTMWA